MSDKPLRELLTGEPLMPDRAIELLCQIAEGLAAIHEQGKVHGDLKPENIIVTQTPTGERAKLVEPAAKADGSTVMLEAGTAVPDVPTDIRAFGVVAFELLSGEPPGTRPLSEAAPHLVDNKKLLDLVARCLDADPAKRPLTARELALKLGRVPHVGEPTILMEALQFLPPALPKRKKPTAHPEPVEGPAKPAVPPPLPAPAPAPVVAAAPASAAPKPLLASVIMPSPSQIAPAASPLMDPVPLAPAPPPKSRVAAIAALSAVAALAIAGIVMSARKTPAQEARALLEAGKPKDALEILRFEIREHQKRSDPAVLSLVAVAMHQLDQHRDEEKVFRDELAPKAPEVMDPFVLSGLVEDHGKREDGPSRELLRRMPKEQLVAILKPMAEGEPSAKQWGALRYLDGESATSDLDLVKLYVAALGSDVCSTKAIAAKRLGQLGDKFAEEPLNKLKAEPKGDKPCGQAEAAQALTQLAKKKPE
jgi:hypothetical protein